MHILFHPLKQTVHRSVLVALLALVAVAGCGFEVQQPDLFLLTRSGSGPKLTMLVNSGGTMTCNGSHYKAVPDEQLLEARKLSGELGADARRHLHISPAPNSVYDYTVKVQGGTIAFPDTATRTHPLLAQLVLLALQLEQNPCHLG